MQTISDHEFNTRPNSIRLGPLGPEIRPRMLNGASVNDTVRRDLMRYYALVSATPLSTLGLNQSEFEFVAAIIKQCDEPIPVKFLWAEVQDGDEDIAAAFTVDQFAVATKIREMPFWQATVLLDKAERA